LVSTPIDAESQDGCCCGNHGAELKGGRSTTGLNNRRRIGYSDVGLAGETYFKLGEELLVIVGLEAGVFMQKGVHGAVDCGCIWRRGRSFHDEKGWGKGFGLDFGG
jgi:hypothetical protein